MKYFGVLSFLVVVAIVVVWSEGSFFRSGQYADEDGNIQATSYQDALNSAQSAADSISDAGTVKIEIYDGISFVPSTVAIDLSGRNLSGSLKAEIRKLSDLEVLDISNNNFTGLPAEVGQLTKLKVLNLANNPLTGLPRELGQLQSLEVLNISGTEYSQQDMAAIESQLPVTTTVITQ